jgi:hypothetical protein
MTTLKAIDKRIVRIGKLGADLNVYVHDTAMLIVTHAATVGNGDVTRVDSLLSAIPNSFRKTAFRSWLAKYTPIVLEGGKNGESHKARLSDTYKAIKDQSKRDASWKLSDAMAEPFYAIADKVSEEKDLDLAALIKMVQGLGARITAKADAGKVVAGDVAKAKDMARALANLGMGAQDGVLAF